MITQTALTALQFSVLVAALALLARLACRRRPALRRAATRVVVMFGVFAAAAAYIWSDLGPEIDHLLEVGDQPLLLNPPPDEMEV